MTGTGQGRNAFISLGVTAKNVRGIDIGLRNRGIIDPDSNPVTDAGYGWHPYCIELDADVGHYYDGQKNIHMGSVIAKEKENHKAPSGAKSARFEIVPNPNGKSVRFTVTWLDAGRQSDWPCV